MAKAAQRRVTAPPLEQTVVREFQGGWNVIDNELNLTPKFASVMDNWVRAADGSMQVRYGYELFADAGLVNIASNVPLLLGDIINGTWFQNYLIVVDSTGIVARLSPDGKTGIRVWDSSIAASQIGSPAGWGTTNVVNFFSNSGKLNILNGNDPPLVLDSNNTPICQYLADASTGSNYGVPKALFGISDVGFAVMAGDAAAPTTTHISAKFENGVFATNTNPDDAVDVDMSKITSTIDATITGIGQLRGTLVITYKDGLSLGTLGQTTTVGDVTSHDPQFDDQISLSGCIANRSIVSLGSDMFLCDRVGIPSLSRSTFGQLIPDRVSQLIEPELQKNIARLSDVEVSNRIFAVFNPRERQYMLFLPKHSASPVNLPPDPITTMGATNQNAFQIYYPAHAYEEGDTLTIAGATSVGPVSAGTLNTSWNVVSVIDTDNFVVSNNTFVALGEFAGGGSSVTLTATNIETIGYIFTYNPKLKIQAWARFRGMAWNWGAVDIPGRVYLGVGRKVYRYGTAEAPISADRVNDYDYTWTNGAQYSPGNLVADTANNNIVYVCNVPHVSSNTGTFSNDRGTHTSYWSPSVGIPIDFAWEWPWGDFGSRSNVKAIRGIRPEAQGQGEYTLQIFVDNLYKSRLDGSRTPVRSLSFMPNEAEGFGGGPVTQPFGGGRNTRYGRVWPIPVNCNIYKLRFEGSTTEPLRIVSVSLLYHKGGLAR